MSWLFWLSLRQMCLEQLYSVFWLSGGGLGWSRFYLSGDSFALHLGLREPLSWVNGERGHGRAWFVTLVSVGLVVIGDSSMVGVMVSSWIKLVELIVLPTDPGVGRVRRLCSIFNDAQRQGDSCRGLGSGFWSNRADWCVVIYWWDVGLRHFLVVMFIRCSIRLAGDQKVVGWAMIDFNRWSEMEVCDRSRFELCHLTRIHVVRLSRILVGGWLLEYWLVLMGSVVKSSMTPGWVKSRFLNGDCGDRDDRKLKLEMWVIVVWIKGNHILSLKTIID